METLDLTREQLDASTSEHRNIVVGAGPGAGKTKTLIERINYLIALNRNVPMDIVVITFTNAAAKEIVERLECQPATVTSATPGRFIAADPVTLRRRVNLHYCGTLHGFCLRLLKEHGKEIGLRGRLALLDEQQQKRFRDDVVKEMKFKGSLKEVNAAIACGPEQFLFKRADGQTFADAQLVAFEYYQRLLSNSVLDFDSVLKFAAVLIDKLNAREFRWPFRHLLWDEFQDSGDDDARIHRGIWCGSKFTIGDPDQSIYGFRGGSPAHLLALMADKSAHRIILQANFRCDSEIANTANRVIAKNPGTHVGTMSRTGQPGKIWTWRAHSEAEECRGIAEDINMQNNPKQCAVLVRSNALAERFAKGLEAHGIPVAKKEKTEKPGDWFTARGLINLFANPDNDLLAFWWIENQKGARFANAVKVQALNQLTSINRDYLHLPDGMTVSDVPAALAKSGIGPESLALVTQAAATLPADATMAELSFALGDDQLHRKEVGDGVTITTMHSAKGREWDCVYLPAFEAGIMPVESKNSSIEEERRLLFVAITRARHKLSISFSEMRKPQWGGFKPERAEPSMFIPEMRP